jgi:Ca2+-binding RTX toxin-like protein
MSTISGTSSDDELFGTTADDTIDGNDGDDKLHGGAGNDILRGGLGVDRVFGDDGDDLLLGGLDGEFLDGGEGTDTLSFQGALVVSAVYGVVVILNERAVDPFSVGRPNYHQSIENAIGTDKGDTIIGDSGPNVINGLSGEDHLRGGGGNDVLTTTLDDLQGSSGWDDIYGGAGDDTISSGNASDILGGGPGNDRILSHGGDDTLVGDEGDDFMDGGAGNDTVAYRYANGVYVDLSLGRTSGDGDDSFINIENATGSLHTDTLTGDAGPNILDGGAGDDTIFGGPGDDVLVGGFGTDRAAYASASSSVTVDLVAGTATGGDGDDSLSSIEDILGSQFNDTLIGDSGSNRLEGLWGDDSIFGAGGDDAILGGSGDDSLDGGSGVDTVEYESADGPVSVDLLLQRATGVDGSDTLLNFEHVGGSTWGDSLVGNGDANAISGRQGNDTITGGAGDDIIDGGDGIDTAAYGGPRWAYSLAGSGNGYSVTAKSANDGIDLLTNIERCKFSDCMLALDMDGHAGQTAKVLGVVFGPASIANKQFVGVGLSLLDGGLTYEQLAGAAVAATGRTSHVDAVTLLWTNLFGSAPTEDQAAPIVALLDSGVSIGALTVAAAESSLNALNINLIGLAQSGIEYVPLT